MGPPGSSEASTLLPDPLRHLLLREVRRVPRCPAQLVHRQPVPALVARARCASCARMITGTMDQVLVVLVAEESTSLARGSFTT